MAKPVIICVDDEKIVLDSLSYELNKSFSDTLNVEIAESPEEALELIDDLRKSGEVIPIIISDWLMPNMKGDEFLIKVHKILPQTRKLLLTGQATPEGIGNVVNQAKLYRYIAKPWEQHDLDLTVTEAFKSYYSEIQIKKSQKELAEMNISLEAKVKERTKECELQRDEIKELLDKTLNGFVAGIIDIISNSNPELFKKAVRMRNYTRKMIQFLKIEPSWEFEISALLSQIGCLNIDKPILDRFLKGEALAQKELNVFQLHPIKTHSVLKKIPHLENIAEGILNYFDNMKLSENTFREASRPIKISKVLRIAHDYDQYIISGTSIADIKANFIRQKTLYDMDLFTALVNDYSSVYEGLMNANVRTISSNEFKIGMILHSDLKNSQGTIVLNAGEEISEQVLLNLIQIKKNSGFEEPIFIVNQ